MPPPFKPTHKLLFDLEGDNTFSRDVSSLVWDGDDLWGTNAEYGQSEIRFQTAQGGIVLLNDGSLSLEDRSKVINARLQHDDNFVTEFRAIPSVHEELDSPDFLYWRIEGRNAHRLRTVHDFYERPQSAKRL